MKSILCSNFSTVYVCFRGVFRTFRIGLKFSLPGVVNSDNNFVRALIPYLYCLHAFSRSFTSAQWIYKFLFEINDFGSKGLHFFVLNQIILYIAFYIWKEFGKSMRKWRIFSCTRGNMRVFFVFQTCTLLKSTHAGYLTGALRYIAYPRCVFAYRGFTTVIA